MLPNFVGLKARNSRPNLTERSAVAARVETCSRIVRDRPLIGPYRTAA